MYYEKKNPYLQFEFANKQGQKKPITFEKPLEIVEASTIEEVIPSLKKVEDAVTEGYYAAGYLSYEAAPAFDSASNVRSGSRLPLLWFGIFEEPINVSDLSESKTNHMFASNWVPSIKQAEYNDAISRIKTEIENGNTYQVNYTMRLHSEMDGDDYEFFKRLKQAQSSNYSAYLNIGRFSILSASPELFFRWDGDNILTKPMKGTKERGKWLEQDKDYANWLHHSEKNRAENVMIVDLLRNDLGRIAVPGTVQVPQLFEVETYPTVHQMTSTVTAKTNPEVSLTDVFQALFPCGSITGAPKVSTMDIISKLEDTTREVYCGAIGYIEPNGEAIFNVPIRTVLIDHQTHVAEYGVGGGITWDSTAEDEFEEAQTKAQLLTTSMPTFRLVETMKLSSGKINYYEEHIKRLSESAEYFGFNVNIGEVEAQLKKLGRQLSNGMYRIRLLTAKDGSIELQQYPLVLQESCNEPKRVILADDFVSKDHIFLYHKTTHRKVYEQFQTDEYYDTLMWNEDDEITEFTTGNLVVEIGGELFTPARQCGLLAGTLRERLLHEGKIKEKVLYKKDIFTCKRMWYINSVRGWIPVKFVSNQK